MLPRPDSILHVFVVAGPCLLILAGCTSPVDGSPTYLALSADPTTVVWVDLAPATESPGFEHPAAEKIDSLGAEAMAVLSDMAVTEEARQWHFREILARELDIPLLARFMLGRYWRDATPEARHAYEATFAEYVLLRYAALLGGAREIEGFEVVGSKTIENGDVLVETRIRRGGAKLINAGWRMHDRDGRFVVIDLLVEGLSMAQTLRQEFASILRANGGRVEELVSLLKQKVT